MLDDHPVITTKFLMSSVEVARICSIASFKIYMRKTGVVFFGPSRLGKTRCFDILAKEAAAAFSWVYVSKLPAVNREGNSKATIIQQLAFVEKVESKARETRLQLFLKLVGTLEFKMRNQGKSQFVFFIDELQRFVGDDFYQLADLYNALDEKGIKMTVISFAMPEIKEVRSTILELDQRQIVSRFLSEFIGFNGIRSEKDINVILEYYDSNSEFPPESGVTYTMAFLPKAYKAGFRLRNMGGDFWRHLNKVATGDYHNNLPMEHFMMFIKYILLIGGQSDSNDFSVSERLIRDAIAESGLRDFCKNK